MNSSANNGYAFPWAIGVAGLLTAMLIGRLYFTSVSSNSLRSKIENTNSLFRSLSKLHDLYLEENGKAITKASELGRLKKFFSSEFQKRQHLSTSEVSIVETRGFIGRDAFDLKIRIETDSINYLYFKSDGPDGVPNTSDDISRRFSWIQSGQEGQNKDDAVH